MAPQTRRRPDPKGLLQLAGRTVAVQLIREQMFRACEAYSNGRMTGTDYTQMMNNLNRTMVTFLLGEVAGGRKHGVLGAKASASATASLGGLSGDTKKINEVAKELTAAENDLTATGVGGRNGKGEFG